MLRVYVGGFLLPMGAAVAVTTYVLCLVVTKRPSKTDPYNTANIISHAITLVTLISSVGLKFPQPEDAWLTPALIGLALTIVQVPFWVYLVKVSFANLRKMIVIGKAEAKTTQKKGFYQGAEAKGGTVRARRGV